MMDILDSSTVNLKYYYYWSQPEMSGCRFLHCVDKCLNVARVSRPSLWPLLHLKGWWLPWVLISHLWRCSSPRKPWLLSATELAGQSSAPLWRWSPGWRSSFQLRIVPIYNQINQLRTQLESCHFFPEIFELIFWNVFFVWTHHFSHLDPVKKWT